MSATRGDLFKIKLSDILANCQFWLAILVIYYQWRDIPLEQIYFLLSFYSLCAFLFEFPTGVISDYFSPKFSLICGYMLSAIGMILHSFPGTVYYYGFLLFLTAIGFTLTSGSDTALLHAASKNFKSDYSQVKMWGLVMSAFSASIGGLVAIFDLRIPLYLTALFFVISAFLLFFVRSYKSDKENVEATNMFSTAQEGIRHVFNNKKLSYLLLVSSFIGIFIISFKFFFNPLFQQLSVPLPLWGIFISCSILLSALGIRVYKSYSQLNLTNSFILFIGALFFIGFVWVPGISLIAFFLTYFIRGYFETQLDVFINESITSHARASVLSLKSVLIRIGQTAYTFLGGLIIAQNTFFPLMSITVVLLIVGSVYPLYKLRIIYGTK